MGTTTISARRETRILKGVQLAKRLRGEIAAAREYLQGRGGTAPVLATLLVGDNPAALAYRASIARTFGRVEIAHRAVERSGDITNDELMQTVRDLNADPEITGILVLMPLPAHLDPQIVIENLSPLKDVDGITPTNAGRLHLGLPSLRPSTPAGGLELLDFHQVPLEGARVTVIGRSNVVGRPLATLLTQRSATVTLCHSRTHNLAAETGNADVVCLAAGSPRLVTGEMIRPGATVLDFGVNVLDDGSVVGDADFDSMLGVASAVTPVPGGTGPVTALVLARNTLAAGFAALEGSLDGVLYEIPEAILRAHTADLEVSVSVP
ncbi:MAG: bifunctional 5,10-methylenetetrahydrofolate dehydrogenase/5,10-methenyltetrahydrofolate cyclohydrolase [Thermomicrobiales bacterium]